MKRILQIFSNRMRLAALAAGLLCAAAIAPAALHAQSVYFAGTPTVTLGGGFNEPQGVAVDAGGNVYVADVNHSAVKEIPANCIAGANNASCVLTLGGGFNTPTGVAVDGSGNVFVADYDNGAVKEIPANCIAGANNASCVLTLGGGFSYPEGVAVDGSGNVFVADLFEPSVQEISANCIAGANNASCVQTLGGGFAGPTGVAVDGNGNVFVADLFDASVKEIPANCIAGANNASCVRTLGGGFASPAGVTVDGSGDVFVADDVAPPTFGEVYEIPASCIAGANNANCVRTLGGAFVEPKGVAVDAKGDLFVGDVQSDSVVEFQAQSVNFGSANVCPAGQTTPAPCSQTIALNYNVTASGTLGTPQVLTGGAPNLDFTLAGGSTCTGSVTAGSTCTVNVTFAPRLAGARNGAVQILDAGGNVLATTFVYGTGIGPQIAYNSAAQTVPFSGDYYWGVAFDAAGDVFLANSGYGNVTEFPSGGGNSKTLATGLNQPANLAIDGAGNLYVAYNAQVSSITEIPTGCTSSSCWISIGGDLQYPTGVAVDGAGNVYVADNQRAEVLEFPAGCTTSSCEIVAISGVLGYAVAVDGSGNIFFPEAYNTVLRVPPGCNNRGCGTQVASGFSGITGIAVDAAGDLFVADDAANAAYEVTPAGVKTTLSTGTNASGIGVDAAGDVFMTYVYSSTLELKGSQPPSLSFASTAIGQTSSDSPQSVAIQNIGNASLSLTGLSVAANFGQVDGAGSPEDCTSSTSLAAGASCNLSLSFTPTTAGAIQGSAVLTDNALNGNPATQTIALTGMATQISQTITFTGLPATAIYGAAGPYTLNGTASSGLPVSYNVSGPATIVGSTLTITGPGPVIVIASQAGNSTYLPATPVPQTIEVSAPALSVQYASTQLVYPGATNLTACIAPAHGVTATGSVQIFDGNTLLTTISVQGGGCAYWYISPGLAAGSHVLTAVYSGDKNNPAGPSVPTTINVAPVPVKLAPACWLTNTGYGANYQCTVSLSSKAGSAQGVMTYSYDGASPVSVPVNNGTANFTLTRPAAGSHSVVIAYAQQTNYAAAGPVTENFTVSPAAVYVQLTPSSWYTSASAGISFTATVNSSSAGAPNSNGSVAFFDGNTPLATAPVNSSGQASYSTKTLAAGPHTITATYSGGTNYASGSSSVSITLTK
jgi:hypothetical protein